MTERSMDERMRDTTNVEVFMQMMNKSLETISEDKRENDKDVQMLLAFVGQLQNGLKRTLAALRDVEDRIEGLRSQMRGSTV